MICKICKLECKSGQSLAKHIHCKHNMTSKEYYNTYLKQPNEGNCLLCKKETPFLGLTKGYQKYCCARCAQNSDSNIFKVNNPTKHRKDFSCQLKHISFTCNMCGKSFTTKTAIRNHIINGHKMSLYDYWSQYQLNKCSVCGADLKVSTLGFEKYCSRKCRNLSLYNTTTNIGKTKRKQERIKLLREDFEQHNDFMPYLDVLNIYGQGWLAIKDTVPCITYAGKKYITDLTNIIEYCKVNHYRNNSIEQLLIDKISEVYDKEIIHHTRKIISPLELDIYLPDIKLAIEYNGIYWHSIEAGTTKDYHLNKSIACRDKGIRLIHIYSSEDFDEHISLLQKLLLGQDDYPKGDFNKNNLTDHIPEPTIIYKDTRLTVYGAGPLL